MRARFYLLGALVLLAGCQGTSVVLDNHYPQPLVKTIPVSIGVYYPDEFKVFRHVKKVKDKSKGKAKYVVDVGTAQVSLFDTLLAGVFSQIENLDSFPPAKNNTNISGVIVPEIVRFELSVPDYTQDKIYEVWVNYRMRLFKPDGTLVMEWPLIAYGKTPLKFFKLKQSSLTQASHAALRDAGVQFILSLERPQLRQWLNSQSVATRDPSRLQAESK